MKPRATGLKQTSPCPMFTAETYDALVQMLPAWTFRLDRDYRVAELSPSVERIAGIKVPQVLGLRVTDPGNGVAGRANGLDAYNAAIAAHAPIQGLPYERRLADGSRTVLMESALPRFDETGHFQGYDGITIHLSKALEITDATGSLVSVLQSRARHLENALEDRNHELEQSNRLLREVLDAMGEGLLVTTGSELNDPDNRVLFVNPAYQHLMDLSDYQVFPGQRLQELAEIMRARGDVLEVDPYEVSRRLNSAETVRIDIASTNSKIIARSSRSPGGGHVIVHTDITQQVARSEALDIARREADSASQAKSEFLASLSHELRTPMNGIVGMADLLAGTELSDNQTNYVETIRSSALALTRMISDILDFSKIEVGQVTLEDSDFSLLELCQEVAAMMAPMAEMQGLSFALTFDEQSLSHLRGDVIRLRQVLVNLLGNAVKFTVSGSVGLSISGSNPTVIEVSDTGIGIPEDKLTIIFSPFEQAQGGLQRQFEGTGLGLAISQTLVVAMGGTLTVESVEGVGTKFFVTLPVERTAPASLPQSPTTTGPRNLRPFKVLVAEDNKTNQKVISKMLDRFEADVTLVDNGRAAVETFLANRFDVVLMDLSMPRMNGLDATRLLRRAEVRQGASRTPVVALTGNAFEQDRQAAMEVGMDDFLTKPLRLDDLRTCLEALLEPTANTAVR